MPCSLIEQIMPLLVLVRSPRKEENITRIKVVHDALGELATGSFTGGSTEFLYIGRMADEVCPTDDVDILIKLTGRVDYAAPEEQLRNKGFGNDVESGVI